MGTQRTVTAFVVAPLAAPFVVVFLSYFWGSDHFGSFKLAGFLVGISLYSVYVLPLAYLAELLLGLPAWLIYRHFSIRSWPAFAAGGALIGLLFYIGIGHFTGSLGEHASSKEFLSSPYLGIDVMTACVSGILFRAVVFSGRPQSAPRQAST